jgi:hypothetical protein
MNTLTDAPVANPESLAPSLPASAHEVWLIRPAIDNWQDYGPVQIIPSTPEPGGLMLGIGLLLAFVRRGRRG